MFSFKKKLFFVFVFYFFSEDFSSTIFLFFPMTRKSLLFLLPLLLLPLLSHPQILHTHLLGKCGALAHVHMAKTGGSTFNKEASFRFERVCGNKGNTALDQPKNFHMKIGRIKHDKQIHVPFFDCDMISMEINWESWAEKRDLISSGRYSCGLVALIPCREPFEHMLSTCNHKGTKIPHSIGESPEELYNLCRGFGGRFDLQMFNTTPPIFSRDFCFQFEDMKETLENLEHILQPRVRPLTEPRDFLIEQKTAASTRKDPPPWLEARRDAFNSWARTNIPYYNYCSSCLDVNQWVERELSVLLPTRNTTRTTKKNAKKKRKKKLNKICNAQILSFLDYYYSNYLSSF